MPCPDEFKEGDIELCVYPKDTLHRAHVHACIGGTEHIVRIYLETYEPVGNDTFPSGRKRDVLEAIKKHERELWKKCAELQSGVEFKED